MIWELFLAFGAFLQPGNWLDVSPEHEFSPYGPQTPAEIVIARTALHRKNGDMLFSQDYNRSAGIKDTTYRWPGYPGKPVIPYVISPSLSSIQPLIQRAMDQYNKLTCIKFVPRNNQKDYIQLVKTDSNGKDLGCLAYVGRIGKGMQEVWLGDGCEYIGTIVHELGHAVGLYHEHQRSDRDDYITVYKENVGPGLDINFDKTNPSKELIFAPYDYNSIMHYGSYAFSVDEGKLPTMVAKNGVKLLEPYEKPGLTNYDIITVKQLYQCK